jgi:lantibiotic biosynthesis protein
MTRSAPQQALAVAERLLDPDIVLAAIPGPDGSSLSTGLAGTALLHARLACTDRAFAAAAMRHWSAAASRARSSPSRSAGIYHSPGGLAASLIIGSAYLPDPRSQQGAAAQAADWLSSCATSLACREDQRLQAGGTVTSWAAYDVISGLAGIGRILLAAVGAGTETGQCESALASVLKTLTAMILTNRGRRPGWWLPPSAHPLSPRPPASGAANTGMAHGIAGPLALLSIAAIADQEVPGQHSAISAAAQWLLRWRDPKSGDWAPCITGADLDSGTLAPTEGRRDAWCYGIPGISQALSLAGRALGEEQLTQAAKSAIASMASRPGGWDVAGPALCHGHAGVLQCAAAIGDTRAAGQAASAVTAAFNHPEFFRFHGDDDAPGGIGPGFLTGAAGAALALADHGGLPAQVVPARWDCLLLLS